MEGTLSLFDWRPAAPPARARCVLPTPRVIVFDCETTGIDFTQGPGDRAVRPAGLDDRGARSQVWRIKPTVPIHPAAQAVHGISMADLEECARFAAYADEIAEVFANAEVIIGYNLSFDIDMLQAEYVRIGKPMLDLTGKKIVDAFRLWQQCEPRSLQHAHRRFVGDEFAAAHRARPTSPRPGACSSACSGTSSSRARTGAQIATVCDPQRASWVGPSRHLRWEDEVDRARLRQAHGRAAARARERPGPQLPALGVREGFPAARRSRSAAPRSSAAARSWSRGRASATGSRRRRSRRRSLASKLALRTRCIPCPRSQPPFAK